MATESADRLTGHLKSITVTSVASLAGVAAGVASWQFAAGPTDRVGLVAFVGATLLGMGVMYVAGVDFGEFSPKDYLYVAFMTFSLWFITWAILLSSV